MPQKDSAEKAVRDIRRKTRRKFAAEEKIRIALEGLRGEESIAPLCRREGIAANLYYRWSKDFLEASEKRLLGDTQRDATSTEGTDLRRENSRLKEVVAETVLENRLLEKSVMGSESLATTGVTGGVTLERNALFNPGFLAPQSHVTVF